MAILFSHVTMDSDYGIGEFFTCGFPNDGDDLDGCIAYEAYLMEVSDDAIIDVHVEAYLYGDGETVRATPEELAYMIQRLEHDPLFLRDHCNNTAEWYIEVFGGGGWVLFHKPPGRDFEVYDDFNANLYRCVRDSPEQLIDELTYTLNSRLDFDYVRKIMHTQASELPDVKRAAYFYQIIWQSYASGLDSFGAQPHRMWNNFPLIR